MRAVPRLCIVLMFLALSLFAQTGPADKKASKKTSRPSVNTELQALKDAVAAQQAQIQALSQQLQQTNQQLQQTNQQFQQAQQQLQQAQQTATDAQQKAAAVASSAAPKDAVDRLGAQVTRVQGNLTENAQALQERERRYAALEATLGRFRWTGDVRLRSDSIFQSYGGCTVCNDRNRARIRIRFGFEGKLNEEFNAGVALATGPLGDPISTNETLTNNFDRKTIALDRGYVTYNPVALKWLSLTGGKFTYTWTRTSVTFDSDINPEGFAEKFSKDLERPVLKNLNLQFMQLFYNEVSGTSSRALGIANRGHDSFAVGGQIGGRLEPLSFWTLTPSFTVLNWRVPDGVLNSNAFAVGATSGGGPASVTVNGTTYPIALVVATPGEGPSCATIAGGATAPQPASSTLVGGCPAASNGMTNSTYLDSNNNAHFLSSFLYADLILFNQFKTGAARWPVNLLLEYEDNLNAASHPFDYTVKGVVANPTAAENTKLGKQSHAYMVDFSVGQQKKKGDIQAGYAFQREEQDAIIATFSESEQRASTNILQHRFYALWRVAPNTTASFTLWHGRTLNPFLQNAVLAPGLTPGKNLLVGQSEPWLNRVQFDLIYTF